MCFNRIIYLKRIFRVRTIIRRRTDGSVYCKLGCQIMSDKLWRSANCRKYNLPDVHSCTGCGTVLEAPASATISTTEPSSVQIVEPVSDTEAKGIGGAFPVWIGAVIASTCTVLYFFSIKSKDSNDQGLLYGLVSSQIICLTIILRITSSFLGSLMDAKSWIVSLGKFFVIAILIVLMAGLSFCSSFVHTGWLGG